MEIEKRLALKAAAARQQVDAPRRPELESIGRTWHDYLRSIGAEIISCPALRTFGFEKVEVGFAAPDRSAIIVPDPHALRNFDREDLYVHMDAELAAKILTVGLP